IKIYVCNIMTQPGETLGYTATDHIKALFDHGLKSLDYVIVNKGEIPEEYKKRYIKDMSEPVRYDKEEIEKMGIKVVEEDLVAVRKEYIRHDEQKLAEVIIDLIN
ncbi:MAG: gluconeogenesis factor YvcK family protein, partial [Caldanaerobacter sp.]